MWNLIALDFQALIYFRDVKVLYVKILVHCSIETWGLGGGGWVLCGDLSPYLLQCEPHLKVLFGSMVLCFMHEELSKLPAFYTCHFIIQPVSRMRFKSPNILPFLSAICRRASKGIPPLVPSRIFLGFLLFLPCHLP